MSTAVLTGPFLPMVAALNPNGDDPLDTSPHCGICCYKLSIGPEVIRIRQVLVLISERHGRRYLKYEEFLDGQLEQYFCEDCFTSRLELGGAIHDPPECDRCNREFAVDEIMFVVDPGTFSPSKRHGGCVFSTMDDGHGAHIFYFCEDCTGALREEPIKRIEAPKRLGMLPRAFR